MKNIFTKNLYFFLPVLAFLVSIGLVLALTDKVEAHLYINQHHTELTDTLFKYITHLGSGWIVLPLCLLLLFVRYNYALMLALAYGVSAGLAQGLKHFVFDNALRPKRYFEEMSTEQLDLINGIDVHSLNSMPSGHTTTAFCIFCLLALFFQKRWLGLLFAVLAILAGFSRVYLSQHFLEDVLVGAIIGLVMAILIFRLLAGKGEKGLLSRSLLSGRT